MKKESAKKLTLSKITIAKLSSTETAMQNDNVPTRTGCSLLKCTPPPVGRN